ncbi:MAG TPA: hypothetical protein DEO70_00525 [Bacteroidales bacterium]|nr:MAG: hypothetical protein A2X11_03215 [Bacteroidetes bacterium GWE2_42_24]OFY30428.1 MAG: hypothetical protein A2X09_12630 [Bacteroidetes bacterium GWF2_43_11]PKP27433.1 MAG: hypothetical protein CVU06_02050 [Bacteroidetes bacterium HGW-Bacteroidetes-22]HBZ65293.1 hypothetical protein [Bacteroidales bacterium]
MFRHFLKTTFSNLKRNPVYSFINIAGLAVGLAAAMLILLHVVNEYSYDRFQNNRDRLVRVLFTFSGSMGSGYSNSITAAVGPTLWSEIPGIDRFVRFTQPSSGYMVRNDSVWQTDGLCYADSSFFDCFSFPVLDGNKKQLLRDPFTMVITRSLAEACFKDGNPIGQTVKVDGKYNVTITGIVADPPENSHIRFKALISFSTLYHEKDRYMDWNGGNQYITWLQLSPQYDQAKTDQLLPELLRRHINDQLKKAGIELKLVFEPMSDVYLYSKSGAEGNPFMLKILTAIALFVLLLACFNYANLSTARAMRRFRETGIRKMAGATGFSLVRFYLAEALLTTLIAWFVALILIELAQPWFNGMVGHDLGLWKGQVWWFVPASLLIVVLTAFVSGLYPAIFLARLEPAEVLKGGFKPGRNRFTLSNALLVIQFGLSAALMTATLIVGKQLDYGASFSRGYDINNVVAVELTGEQSKNSYAEAKAAFSQMSATEAVAAISEIPVDGVSQNGYRIQDYPQVKILNSIETDPDFFRVMKVPVIAGTDFEHSSLPHGVMINQKLAEEMGWMDADGQPIAGNNGNLSGGVGKVIARDTIHRIIGITANFHHSTLYEAMGPLVIARKPYTGYNYILIRAAEGQVGKVITGADQVWQGLFPDEPFVAYPVTSMVEQGLRGERNLQSMLNAFAWLALFIAAMGLAGLASYQTRQRQRGTGLRLILGASPTSLIMRDAFRFLKLVVLADVLALPLIWWAMDAWLEGFVYRIPFPWWLTVPVLFTLLFLGLIAVIAQVMKTVRTNPVEAVRYE